MIALKKENKMDSYGWLGEGGPSGEREWEWREMMEKIKGETAKSKGH